MWLATLNSEKRLKILTMELKKTPKADLQNKRSLFLLVGMIIALAAVILAFDWSKPEVEIAKFEMATTTVESEMVEQTRHEEQKVEPPKVAAPQVSEILEITNEKIKPTEAFKFDSEFDEFKPVEIKAVGGGEEDLAKEETPVIKAEKMPTFQGGDLAKFREWVFKNLVYPSIAEENNITGKVVLRIVVERDGSVKQIEVMTSPDKSLSDEAVRVVSKSPNWVPGEQRGKKVRVAIVVPIDFRL